MRRLIRRIRARHRQATQLRMNYPNRQVSAYTLPCPYNLRPWQPGDEGQWVNLLNGCRQLGTWNLERLEHEISNFHVTGTQYFVSHDCSQLVSGAGVYKRSSASWEIGWVATMPKHRGHGLAKAVTTAAILSALNLPSRPICLFTDDYRLPAIKSYLKIGFVPDCNWSSDKKKWDNVFKKLGSDYESYRSSTNLR